MEMMVASVLSALITLTAAVFAYHALFTTGKTENHLVIAANAENAGYWIKHDATMADNILTENLTPPAILVLKWTEWGYEQDNIYHTATYSIENVSDNIGQLKRRYQTSTGTDRQMVVAGNVYYNPADPDNSTAVTHQSPAVILKLATQAGTAGIYREYRILRRPNF